MNVHGILLTLCRHTGSHVTYSHGHTNLHYQFTISVAMNFCLTMLLLCQDVGGGLGHLSRYLALVHKFRVVTIESEGHHKIRAEQFDKLVTCLLLFVRISVFYFFLLGFLYLISLFLSVRNKPFVDTVAHVI